MDEDKLKYADLAQHNFTSAVAGKTSSNDVHLSVILLTVFRWPMQMVGPGGLLLLVPLLFDVQVSQWEKKKKFHSGVAKKYITITWMCKILLQGHILSSAGDAL